MAVAFKGIGTQAITNDSTGTTKPCAFSSNVEGDFLLACCASSNTGANPSINWLDETGWTRMAANSWLSATAGQTTFYYRFAPPGGISSQTFDTASTTGAATVGLVFTGVDPTTPIDVGPNFNNHTTGTTTSVTPPAYTTATAGAMGIISMNRDAAPVAITFPGSYVDRIQTGSALPGDGVINCIGTLLHGAAGTQTPGAFTWTGAQEACAMSFALRAAPEGGNFDQDSFRGRNDDGNETTATWKAAANTDWTQQLDTNFRVRFLIEELDDVEDLDVQFQLQYNVDAGGWNDVNASSSNVRSSASPNVTDGANTTEQMSGPGTFIGSQGGFDEVNGLAGNMGMDFTTTVNQETEVEFCCQLRSAELAPGATVQLRLLKEPDISFGSYTNTPTLSVPAAEYTVDAFRLRNDDGNETTATWKADANVNVSQDVDTNFRVRFLISEGVDIADANVSFQLQYNYNGGGWNDVDAASSVARSFASPNVTDAANTTQQIGSSTYISTNAGFDEVDGLAGGASLDFTTTVDQEVEVEYCLQLRSVDTTHLDGIQLRVVRVGGTGTIVAYSNTPLVTARFPQAFKVNSSANITDGEATTRQLTLPFSFTPGSVEEALHQKATRIQIGASQATEIEYVLQATGLSAPSTQYEFRLADECAIGELLDDYAEVPRLTTSA